MSYPIWELPASGLLIALVAIVHVFISHFAVGGGLFLVVTERKARRDGDEALLAFVKRHTRFFVLLTLVLGAMTGVGIWFTIGLVHPQATASLINAFVWGWAIEWTFFVGEIAAAMVYYLHIVTGAIATASVVVSLAGLWLRRGDEGYGRWMIRYGALWFASATVLNMVVGLWWLARLPQATLTAQLGQNLGATVVLRRAWPPASAPSAA